MSVDRRALIKWSGFAAVTSTGITSCSKGYMASAVEGRIIEIVSFRLLANMSDTDFMKAAQASNRFIKQQAGFVARRLSKSASGVWADHVEWASLADAKSAGDKFMTEDVLKPFMNAIDPSTIIMGHNVLMLSA